MRLSSKVEDLTVTPDEKNTGERDWTCGDCDQTLKGHWGHCPTCCLTFPQQLGFDRHRVGKYENRAIGRVSTRRCLTEDELREREWQYDLEHNVWRLPERKTDREDTE